MIKVSGERGQAHILPRNLLRLGCYFLHAAHAAKRLREFKCLLKGGDEPGIALTAELIEQCFEIKLLTVHVCTPR
jgi:hypothetical protein